MDLVQGKTHIVLVNALVAKKDKFLISQRSFEETNNPGKWTIPGGKVEITQGNIWRILEKTLEREVAEETGVRIKKSVELIINNTFIRSTGHHVIALVFLCQYHSGKAKPLEDTIKVSWVTKKDLSSFDLVENVRVYLSQGFKRIKFKQDRNKFS